MRGTARNVTEQHRAALEIERLATHDGLTGLPNRVSLQKVLEAALPTAKKARCYCSTWTISSISTTIWATAPGDQLLIAVGGLLKDLVEDRQAVQVFRLGGDEFAMHLPNALRRDAAKSVSARCRLCDATNFPMPWPRLVFNADRFVGVATYPFHGADVATLLANVDIAMYQAKDNGRNRVRLHDQNPDDLRSTHKRVHWARELREVSWTTIGSCSIRNR